MYVYRIKLVPDAAPNAEGRWQTVVKSGPLPEGRWTDTTTFFHSNTPAGEHIVAVERDPGAKA